MRLSDLNRFAADNGLDDPIVAVEDRDGMPVDPADVDFGVVMTDAGPRAYVLLATQGEN